MHGVSKQFYFLDHSHFQSTFLLVFPSPDRYENQTSDYKWIEAWCYVFLVAIDIGHDKHEN